ncbi:tail protein X [Wohlfahrtiimonas larvae]|uniref:Phage tail protein n=1 Tax=Wohlfahrtiimonas larvae TaxID=1157986 RepID=A0ABP9MIU2_9GAMM|nr:tail protein X [Wohlfahrtiimonas larvae]
MSRVLTVQLDMPLDLLLHKNGIDTSQVNATLELPANRHLAKHKNMLPMGTKVTLPEVEVKPVKEIIQLWS